MYRPPFSSRTARTKAPKKGRVRLGAVNPAMTTSWRFEVLILSQSVVRAPDTYLLSARFAMMPSRPCRPGWAEDFGPEVFPVGAEGNQFGAGKEGGNPFFPF